MLLFQKGEESADWVNLVDVETLELCLPPVSFSKIGKFFIVNELVVHVILSNVLGITLLGS